MKLVQPFPSEVRNLFLDCWSCWVCGGNGTNCGGLELHHIYGRVSGSAFNAAVLCKKCHDQIGHTQAEHQRLFKKTVAYLYQLKEQKLFKITNPDNLFLAYIQSDIATLDLSTALGG